MAEAAPWLAVARQSVGVKEIAGDKDNPTILAYYADCGWDDVEHDETPWCAAFAGSCLKRAGYPIPPKPVALLARSYLTYGTPLEKPEVGCIVVFKRGNSSTQGHVGFVVEVGPESLKVLGGNQADAVNVREFPRSAVLGYRWPVGSSVAELKDAGSSEIKVTDAAKKVAGGVVAVGTVAETVQNTSIADQIKDIGTNVDAAKPVLEGMDAIARLLAGNVWLLLIALGVGGYLAARWWVRRRLERHRQGHPITGAA